jgi:twitching motility protein PilT
MNIKRVLQRMVDLKASDLHVKVGTKPTARVNGTLTPLDEAAPSQADLESVVDQILTPKQKRVFEETKEVDFAFGVTGLARFRTNFYQQRGTTAMVFRQVPATIPAFEELNLPPVLEDLALRPRGLVLMCGTVGCGKSTTLAAMIDSVNRREPRNIITIEDPVEFLFRDKKCTISQREIGLDTATFGEGLKHILRQDPDVIMIGEIRDPETMRIALMAADTGHLVLSTLHTIDATQTVNRIISFFPPHQHEEVRFMLASTLQGVIALRLVPRSDREGRIPAVEVMLVTATIREYLLDAEKTSLIKSTIAEGVSQYGMQTFDQSIMKHYTEGKISMENALRYCSNPTEFELRVKGIHATSDESWKTFEQNKDAPKEGPKEVTNKDFKERVI